MIISYSRGYKIYYDGKDWRYFDNNEIIKEDRPCKKCGNLPFETGDDFCLGHIEGVTYACCGHGVTEKTIIYSKQYLEEYAKSIPSMGGTQIGKYIREYVKQVPENTSIVELGTWMGAGTAQIALGLIEAGKNNPIYTYDRFIVSGRQPLKASWSCVELIDKEDSFPIVKDFLSKFPVNISIIKKEIRDSEYHGGPIGLYIDDACKQEKNFEATQRIFWRHFIPNVTVCIFMDYYLFEKTGSENHKIQYNYMQNHHDQFKLIKDRIDETYQDGEEYGAVFLYLGNN